MKNGREQGFRYYDNYNSFFYRLTDAEQFINGLNDEIGDYFSEDDRPVYDEMIKLADEYWNMTTDEQLDDKGEKLYEKMEADAKRILQAIEKMLHDYEYPTDDLIEQEIEACVDKDYGYMADYMVDDDGAIHTGIEIIWK